MSFPIPNPFVWDSSFDVGDAAMNSQHQQLFQRIDALDKARTPENFQALVDLVLKHFHDEEAHSKPILDGAEFDRHKKVHDELVNVAKSLDPNKIGDEQVKRAAHACCCCARS